MTRNQDHPRDMFLRNPEPARMDSTDFEFALAWFRRGIEAERERAAAADADRNSDDPRLAAARSA